MSNNRAAAESPELEDDPWDVFLGDDDLEPQPEPGDFWFDDEEFSTTDITTDVQLAML
jgi:hypothetical protein